MGYKSGNMYVVEQNKTTKENKNYTAPNTNKNINNNYVYTTTQMEMEPWNYYINVWVILVQDPLSR